VDVDLDVNLDVVIDLVVVAVVVLYGDPLGSSYDGPRVVLANVGHDHDSDYD
jgi:hypothetical protein